MRDQQHRACAADLRHVALDDGFALVVERAGGFVKNQDARAAKQRARDRDALALPARQARALFAHQRVVALGQLRDELVRTGQLRRLHHLLDGGCRVGDGDVFAHAALEQPVVLQHHADLSAQLRGIDQGDVDAVDQHPALLGCVQSLHQPRQRALARARTAHDAHHLAGLDVEAEALQGRRGLGPVAKAHCIERDAALDRRQLRRVAGRHFGAGVEHIAQPGHRDAGLLKVGPHLRQAHHRLAHARGKQVEGHEHAHGQLAFHHQMGAVPKRGGVHQLADEAHALLGHAGQRLRAKAGRHIGGELGVPATRHHRLESAGLDGLDAADGFDQQRLVLGAAGELLVEPRAQQRHDRQTQAHVQGQRHQHDQRQRHAVQQHHRDEDHRKHHIEHQRQRVAGEKAADVLELAHACHRVAHPTRLKVRQWQLHQMAKQPRAQFHIDAAGGVAEHIGAQRAECAFEHHHDQQPDHQHVERGQAPVHQHLVHHHLEKQRADQREQLQEQADQQHLAQQPPVFH